MRWGCTRTAWQKPDYRLRERGREEEWGGRGRREGGVRLSLGSAHCLRCSSDSSMSEQLTAPGMQWVMGLQEPPISNASSQWSCRPTAARTTGPSSAAPHRGHGVCLARLPSPSRLHRQEEAEPMPGLAGCGCPRLCARASTWSAAWMHPSCRWSRGASHRSVLPLPMRSSQSPFCRFQQRSMSDSDDDTSSVSGWRDAAGGRHRLAGCAGQALRPPGDRPERRHRQLRGGTVSLLALPLLCCCTTGQNGCSGLKGVVTARRRQEPAGDGEFHRAVLPEV